MINTKINIYKKVLQEVCEKFDDAEAFVNHIQDGRRGGQKGPPTSFSPVTSTDVRISPRKLFDF